MRIGLDAMGGDHAPAEEVKGALAAREHLADGDRIVLVGQEDVLRQHLGASSDWQQYIEIHNASQVIAMNESPVEALRAKPDSSLVVLTQLHREGKVDACVSAGNTGAFVAAAQMNLRRLAGVHRPGIAIVTPTYSGPVIICDVGANVAARPQHLHQYGVMSSLYASAVCNIKSPRVGLLSIGEEDTKGNDLVKATRDLLREDPNVNFIGNIEGRDLFRGVCDVMICDGFVGNVVLKLMEGMIEGVIKGMIGEMKTSMPQAADIVKMAGKAFLTKFDFNEYGGAPLLGVGGICIICHGVSNWRGLKNAVRSAKDFASQRVNARITEFLAQGQRA